MQEDFLHHIWYNQLFVPVALFTTQKEPLQILHKGEYLKQSGPDFFNAQIVIGHQRWAGNIEIHLKSSDWYAHHHEQDKNYDNVILHVVWEHDMDVFRRDNTTIPVLQLQEYVSKTLLLQYQKLKVKKTWINCENSIQSIPQFILGNWKERLFLERLEEKVSPIVAFLETSNYDWEETLFLFLVKNFGLNSNGEAFYELAQSIPFSIVRKEKYELLSLEALFFGQANLLPNTAQENYVKDLQEKYNYLVVKYQLQKRSSLSMQFFRLRPDNFPTIRIAQLAMLYHSHQNLFSKIIAAVTLEDIYAIFSFTVSEYWYSHYNFEKESAIKRKKLSRSFIDLLVINTIIPLKFVYEKKVKLDLSEKTIYFLEQIDSEQNTIVNRFEKIGMVVKNAFESQSFLYLKKEYCDKNKCLHCAIGLQLLKN